jgi:hypothetical protein
MLNGEEQKHLYRPLSQKQMAKWRKSRHSKTDIPPPGGRNFNHLVTGDRFLSTQSFDVAKGNYVCVI